MLNYRLIKRQNPRDPAAPRRYYAVGVAQGVTDVRELVDRISDLSTVTSIDTLAVLEALLKVIPKELSNGRIVRLGDLGTFRLTLKSEGSDQSENFNNSFIKGTNLIFRAGKLFRNVLKNIDFAKAKTNPSPS
jgi:predicted histone-like DNA-binding protein